MKIDLKTFFKKLFSFTKIFNRAAKEKIPSQKKIDRFVDAAGKGDLKAVKKFLQTYGKKHIDAQSKARPFGLMSPENTALIEAAAGGHEAVVKHLLDNGANVLWQDKIGYNARMWAQTRTSSAPRPNAWTRIAAELEALEVALRPKKEEVPASVAIDAEKASAPKTDTAPVSP